MQCFPSNGKFTCVIEKNVDIKLIPRDVGSSEAYIARKTGGIEKLQVSIEEDSYILTKIL